MRHPTRLAGKLPVSTVADADDKAANDGPRTTPAEHFQNPLRVWRIAMPEIIDKSRALSGQTS
jgi:hypothetical protein